MITLEIARKIIVAAERKANELGQPMNIAVADTGGNLVAHVRMDGAWIGSIDIAINKAFTSRAFDISTKDLAKYSQSGDQFFGIHASNGGPVMIFSGGVPLMAALPHPIPIPNTVHPTALTLDPTPPRHSPLHTHPPHNI